MTTASWPARRPCLVGRLRLGLRRAALLAAILALSGAGLARASTLVTITIPDRHGEIPSKWLSYPGPPRADVLLPTGYDAHRRYPLLVLLAGLGNDYASYAANGADPLFDKLHAIVVVPEGANGGYTDWWNNGERGDPAWESYELNEVLPTILRRYRILPQRRYHAIAGVSMGGLGAAYLGGRLPGFFGSVATLSGFVDTEYYAQVVDPGMGAASYAVPNGDDDPDPVVGPPDGFYMTGHNPTALAVNLRQTRVFESTGTGIPSSAGLGAPTAVPEGSALETVAIYPMNQLYVQALRAAGVDVTYQVHPGGHDIPDFFGEIESMLAWGLFKPVVTHPSSWVNDTVATGGQLWDIGYRFAEPPTQVVQFRRSQRSLSITAAGSAVTITTSRGCVIRTPTPASIRLPRHSCSARRKRSS